MSRRCGSLKPTPTPLSVWLWSQEHAKKSSRKKSRPYGKAIVTHQKPAACRRCGGGGRKGSTANQPQKRYYFDRSGVVGHQSLARDHLAYCDLATDRQKRANDIVRAHHALTVSRVNRRNSAHPLAYGGDASSPQSSCCATRAWGERARCRLLSHG